MRRWEEEEGNFHNNNLIVVQTKLYSFRFDCKIVSFTAANTNLMFSVSKKESKCCALVEWKSESRLIIIPLTHLNDLPLMKLTCIE